MKTTITTALFAVSLLGASQSIAAINVPGADGSDGALNITADTVIDLTQAVTGAWNVDNSANAGKGVYDPAQWAVVFKYSSVTVAAGKTLTFKNHGTRAPVIWLVSGNVTVDGTVSLDGQNCQAPPLLAEPGPGGFRGGSGWYAGSVAQSAGFGVGGGRYYPDDIRYGTGGSYGTLGNTGTTAYGNPALLPLIGGSGGAGDNRDYKNYESKGGGGGGGAMLIACANTLTVAGEIRANGGQGVSYGQYSGSGSGGGIRLVADTLEGGGKLNAIGGSVGSFGGQGRVRIERVNNSNTITVVPTASVVPLGTSDNALIFPPAGSPEVKIVSVGGQGLPDDPKASFGTDGTDVALPQTASTEVVIETTNVEQASQMKVRCTPRSNANFTEVSAAVSSVVSTTPLVVRWTATLPVQVGASAVQVRVIRP